MAANSNPLPNPNEKLVRVLETEQEAEALIVKGLLESADIECDLMSIDFPQDVLPMGGVALLVREEDETRAKQLYGHWGILLVSRGLALPSGIPEA